ncbi:NUDIX hydrolase [Candidatus Dependentiae bacterium]|nr:NUDIX hydrolase [Candidatus Dependentiae bacterium]
MKTRALLILLTLSCLSVPIVALVRNAGILPYTLRDNNVHFLLGQDKSRPGQWTDFGGTIENGETPIQTAQREFIEETGAQISGVQIAPQTLSITNYSDSYRMYLVKIDYIAPEELHKNKEKVDFTWFTFELLITLAQEHSATLYSPFARTINMGLETLKSLNQPQILAPAR